jgi:hypothetical protein
MKKIQKLCFLALVGLMVGTSCEKTSNPNPQDECIEGVVIAEARGTNPTPSSLKSCLTVVQIKNKNIGVTWGDFNNCVVITNLDVSLAKLNQKVYFKTFTEDLQCGTRLDCSVPYWSCIIADNLSTQCNPK